MASEREPGIQRILLSAVMLAAIFCFCLQGLQPPSPKPSNAPPDQFSAGRAREALARLLPGTEAPHFTGSAPNTLVRERILREFSRNNYVPKVETAFVCSPSGTCATVNNVVARLDGREKDAVLLSAHYDSAAVSPGASDDGVGVATVLEIARALKSRPAPLHSIIFLIDDGEEAGLLGARAFVQSGAWAKDVRAAVNLDARGTSGPSLLFETGSANAWAARVYAQNVSRPAASSVFYSVYKQLPNDTDFTVFKSAGYQGMNFAFIGNVVQYHTPADSIANVNSASMQHQGDNALPCVLALANADFSRIPQGEAVYFDVFGHGVVRAPARWMPFIALATILLIGFEMGVLLRSGRLDGRQFLRGVCVWILIVAAAAVLALILRRLLQLAGALPANWIAHPSAIEISFWFLAVSVVITLGVLVARGCGFWGLWGATWTWWTLLSVAAAWEVRGVSYVLAVPAATAAFTALPATLRVSARSDRMFEGGAVLLPLAASGIVGFSNALLLYDGLGNRALPGIAALVALLFTPILPLCADFLKITSGRGVAIFWAPVTVAFAAAVASILMPAFSANAPERLNMEYWKDADSGKSQWIVQPASGRLPEAMLAALRFRRADKGPFPWDSGTAFFAPASALSDAAPAPTLTVLESKAVADRRNYRALLRSERGAADVMALFPPAAGVAMVQVNGAAVEAGSGSDRPVLGGWNVYRCVTTPAGGVELTFSLPAGKLLEVYAMDTTYGLPVEGKFLLAARPPAAAPSQNGDVTMVSRRVQLIP